MDSVGTQGLTAAKRWVRTGDPVSVAPIRRSAPVPAGAPDLPAEPTLMPPIGGVGSPQNKPSQGGAGASVPHQQGDRCTPLRRHCSLAYILQHRIRPWEQGLGGRGGGGAGGGQGIGHG